MPTYQYRCSECGNELEAVQKFTDPALTECPSCDGRLRKLFSAVGVVFKGSGFYRTDSRAADQGSGSGNGEKSDGAGEKKSTETKPGESGKSPAKQPVTAGSSTGGSSGTSTSSNGSSGSSSGSSTAA